MVLFFRFVNSSTFMLDQYIACPPDVCTYVVPLISGGTK